MRRCDDIADFRVADEGRTFAECEMPAEELAMLLEGQIDIAMHFGPVGDCVVQRRPLPLRRQRRMPARAVRSIVLDLVVC